MSNKGINIGAGATEIIDEYDHPDLDIDYVLENVLSTQCDSDDHDDYDQLKQLYNSILLNGCNCYASKSTCESCLHGKNYEWNSQSNELVLVPKDNNGLIYECNSSCKCTPADCQNRLVQKGPRKGLIIINSVLYGSKGLATTENIPRGGFICEYAGELLTYNVALRRVKVKEETSMNYILFMNEHVTDNGSSLSTPLATIIDPTKRGNIGRYLNHSCDPNCEILSVRVDCPIPKVGIFAKRFIQSGEELCFHYNEGVAEVNKTIGSLNMKRKACLCRAFTCSGYLPCASIDFES